MTKHNLKWLNIGVSCLAGFMLWFIWQAATSTSPELQSTLARFFISKMIFGANSAGETFFTQAGRDISRSTNPIFFLPLSMIAAVIFSLLPPLARILSWFAFGAIYTIIAFYFFEQQRLIIPYGGPVILVTFAYVAGTLIYLESEKITRSRKLAVDLQMQAEEERKRIAKDLHDEVLPSLSRVMRLADQMQEEHGDSPLPEDMRNRLESTVVEMRSIINDLHPAVLENLGLASSLQHLVDKIGKETNIQASFVDDAKVVNLPPFQSLCIYRIAQEALNNVEKHSGASHVLLSLERIQQGTLCLRISDDGAGGVQVKPESHGLKNISDRAKLIGAKLEWKSPDKFATGTMLVLSLALDSDSKQSTQNQSQSQKQKETV